MSCCGSKRQALAAAPGGWRTASRSPARASAPDRRVAAAPNTASMSAATPPNTAPAPSAALFVYRGGTSMNIRNPATGRLYVFDRPGASQRADPADVPWLAGFPWLERAHVRG